MSVLFCFKSVIIPELNTSQDYKWITYRRHGFLLTGYIAYVYLLYDFENSHVLCIHI